MNGYDLLLILFLAWWPDSGEALIPGSMEIGLKESLIRMANRQEIAQPGIPWGSVQYEMIWFRGRLRDLQDAPKITDSRRFPPGSEGKNLSWWYVSWVNEVQKVQPDYYRFESARGWYLYQIWDLVSEATDETKLWSSRRTALKQLRGLIGEEAYFRGELPSPLPLEYFQRID